MTTTDDALTIIVFEREPFWEPELFRQFAGEMISLRGCRTVRDLDQLTTGVDGCVAVVTLANAPADLLRWLSRRLTSGTSIPVIVIADAQSMPLEWHAREAGALAVVSEFVGGHQLARLCRKQHPSVSVQPFES